MNEIYDRFCIDCRCGYNSELSPEHDIKKHDTVALTAPPALGVQVEERIKVSDQVN